MTGEERIRRMTPEQWNRAVAAAEAYGRALESGDPQLAKVARETALAAGCVDPEPYPGTGATHAV